MLKKIKAWVAKKQQAKKQKKELIRAKKYYEMVGMGALFIQYIQNDIKQMKKEQVNRKQRRRFDKAIKKLELNKEMVEHYKQKAEYMLKWVNIQLNPPKPPKPGAVKIDKDKLKNKLEETKKENKNEGS